MPLFSTSLNLYLPEIPDVSIESLDEFMKIYTALKILQLESTKRTRVIAVFDETATGGQAVSFYTSGGQLRVRLADSTDNTRPCVGFSTYNTPATGSGEVVLFGLNDKLSGLTPGTLYYLSETAGGITSVAPIGAGKIVQKIGYAVDANSIFYNPEMNWTQL